MFLQFLINGLIVAGIYGLIAIGYTLIYGVLKFINFAHGDVCMVGAFFAFFLVRQEGIPIFVAFPICMVLISVLGLSVDRLAYKPLRKTSRLTLLISAIGVSIVLRGVIGLIYGYGVKDLRGDNLAPSVYNLAGTTITSLELAIIVTSYTLMLVCWILIKRTRVGKSIRATAEDSEMSVSLGVNTEKTIATVFVVASSIAAAGGVLVGLEQNIQPNMGLMLGFKAFTASVLGGIGSIPGAILGALALGIAESMAAGYISSVYKDAVALGILIIVLLLRPEGFLGKYSLFK